MKKIQLKYRLILAVLLFGLITTVNSCKKQDDFLNTKPNEALSIINTLSDAQNLLNNTGIFNRGCDPALGELSTDDFYEPQSVYNSLGTDLERNCYIWSPRIYDAGEDVPDWDSPYNQVYYANVVLDALPNLSNTTSQMSLFDHIKGTALFYRSIAFYNLVQTFAMPYDSTLAITELGIPLRLNSNLNIKSIRSTERICYDQILGDLQISLALLPSTTQYPTQPSKITAYALLARIYLAMGNFTLSYKYSNLCLNSYNTLQNFNSLNPNNFPIYSTFSPEEIYHTTFEGYTTFINAFADTSLIKLYDKNDLRLTIYFFPYGGGYQTNSQYDFTQNFYDGISTDEMYLTRAECYARQGLTTQAMQDLNTLLVTRWKSGTFVPYTAANADDALTQILVERRKELWCTGIRWTDLRRLNKDPKFALTLSRFINGKTYQLPPNDPRYALPIPDNEISLSSIQQNPR